MPYIPESHKKYNLLPFCVENGGEAFSYPSNESDISDMLPEGEHVVPFCYDSYAEFYTKLDSYITEYGTTDGELNELGTLIYKYKEQTKRMNIKENWSILRYVGESTDECLGLTHGRYYYWPCSVELPVYEGVIDDEEFTSYSYSKSSEFWEIIEDPTGMAERALKYE